MEKNIPGRGTFQGGKVNTLSQTPPYLPPSQDPEKEICPQISSLGAGALGDPREPLCMWQDCLTTCLCIVQAPSW